MEITFEKVNNEYIAEFEITTDSNLHIEKKCASSTKLYQRTNGGGWDLVDETKNMQGAVDDFDLSALIYPKFIKVVCNAEPLYAEVTTSGEVTEIKSQSKEIEVTSNGTTEVTPDAGFAYLNSVKVKTNVAQSGGGGGSTGGGTGRSIEYFDLRNFENTDAKKMLIAFSELASVKFGSVSVVPTAFIMVEGGLDINVLVSYTLAVGVDLNLLMKEGGTYMTKLEVLNQGMPGFEESLASLRITEEEFYNIA